MDLTLDIGGKGFLDDRCGCIGGDGWDKFVQLFNIAFKLSWLDFVDSFLVLNLVEGDVFRECGEEVEADNEGND
jgi:hypothetical protein